LLRGYYRHAIAIDENTILILKNVVVTVAQFIKFNITLVEIDVRDIKGSKK
jgi:hypothetical protein